MNLIPACFAGLGKVGVLGKEAVAGVDGAGAGALSDVEDQIAAQIGFGSGRGSETVSLVGFENMGRGAIGVGIDGDGGEAQLTAGAQNAQGDFATIGDENFAKHRIQGYRVTGCRVQEKARPSLWARALLSEGGSANS